MTEKRSIIRFKATEWMMRREGDKLVPTITLQILREKIEQFHRAFGLEYLGWKRSDVEHFLNCNNWLYPSTWKEHHVRTVYSILTEMLNVGRIE